MKVFYIVWRKHIKEALGLNRGIGVNDERLGLVLCKFVRIKLKYIPVTFAERLPSSSVKRYIYIYIS